VLQIGGAHPGTDCKRKEINDFTSLASQNVSTENTVRAFFHEPFVAGICFRYPRDEYQVEVVSFLTVNVRFCSRAPLSLRPTAASGGTVKRTDGMPR
jgi:hypothetical protein